MTGVAATANGVMNTLPWGGPTARAATALKLDASEIFVPMIPALAMGLLAVFVLAYVLGIRERKRLGMLTLDEALAREPEPETVSAGTGTGTGGKDRLRKGTGASASGTGEVSGTSTGGTENEDGDDEEFQASTPTGPRSAPSSTGSTPDSPPPCSRR